MNKVKMLAQKFSTSKNQKQQKETHDNDAGNHHESIRKDDVSKRNTLRSNGSTTQKCNNSIKGRTTTTSGGRRFSSTLTPPRVSCLPPPPPIPQVKSSPSSSTSCQQNQSSLSPESSKDSLKLDLNFDLNLKLQSSSDPLSSSTVPLLSSSTVPLSSSTVPLSSTVPSMVDTSHEMSSSFSPSSTKTYDTENNKVQMPERRTSFAELQKKFKAASTSGYNSSAGVISSRSKSGGAISSSSSNDGVRGVNSKNLRSRDPVARQLVGSIVALETTALKAPLSPNDLKFSQQLEKNRNRRAPDCRNNHTANGGGSIPLPKRTSSVVQDDDNNSSIPPPRATSSSIIRPRSTMLHSLTQSFYNEIIHYENSASLAHTLPGLLQQCFTVADSTVRRAYPLDIQRAETIIGSQVMTSTTSSNNYLLQDQQQQQQQQLQKQQDFVYQFKPRELPLPVISLMLKQEIQRQWPQQCYVQPSLVLHWITSFQGVHAGGWTNSQEDHARLFQTVQQIYIDSTTKFNDEPRTQNNNGFVYLLRALHKMTVLKVISAERLAYSLAPHVMRPEPGVEKSVGWIMLGNVPGGGPKYAAMLLSYLIRNVDRLFPKKSAKIKTNNTMKIKTNNTMKISTQRCVTMPLENDNNDQRQVVQTSSQRQVVQTSSGISAPLASQRKQHITDNDTHERRRAMSLSEITISQYSIDQLKTLLETAKRNQDFRKCVLLDDAIREKKNRKRNEQGTTVEECDTSSRVSPAKVSPANVAPANVAPANVAPAKAPAKVLTNVPGKTPVLTIPPPPPSSLLPPPSSNKTTTTDPKCIAKFRRMIKMRIPRRAVEQKMRMEGIDPSLLDTPETSTQQSNSTDSQAQSNRPRLSNNLMRDIQKGKRLKKQSNN
eukprot:g2195.t1